MKKYSLELIVFCSGAVVMILELVGARILAPYLGTSIIVWTGLIGIVLASLSIGYYLGGRLADKGATMARLSIIILGSGLLIALCTMIHKPVLSFLLQTSSDIYFNVVLATTILFGPPSIGLGMITPYAVKMKIRSLETSGSSVGRMYALSTIGSIVGTFLSGFVLVAFFASTNILFFLAVIMGLLSLLTAFKPAPAAKFALAIIGIAGITVVSSYQSSARERGFFDLDSRYNRIQIYQGHEQGTDRLVRVITTSPGRYQSAMYVDDPQELILEYTKYFRLIKHFNPDIKKTLMLGGGAYSFPKHYLNALPKAEIHVVEIDPEFTRLAREHFYLQDSPRLTITHQDGRTYLNSSSQKYDAIVADVFSGSYYIPFQMTTLEAVENMSRLLKPKGVVLMNIISAAGGPNSRYFQAQLKTFEQVFPQVFAFQVDAPIDAKKNQNIMLAAFKSHEPVTMSNPDPELDRMLANLWQDDFEHDLPVLTDNFAPVDRYLIPVIN
ncbi:fused MFS/spermidine synthase [Desulfonatronovibrio hydrogenovorans]|uniref:fused MFS/spermidine synthase n=1 Tax=Desulfonatronovibrio hydrogenovorans TaxID=53245 RepID=UPI0004914682|nr:fused MFS/spermidine synthase [Desulfonatronovibrio hydrogenovorans]